MQLTHASNFNDSQNFLGVTGSDETCELLLNMFFCYAGKFHVCMLGLCDCKDNCIIASDYCPAITIVRLIAC